MEAVNVEYKKEMKKEPKLRFPEFKDDWSLLKLGEIGAFKNGLNKDKEDFGFGSPFVNLMDVFGKSIIENGKFDLVNASDKDLSLYGLKKGDVLFIRSSVKREGVGETVLVIEDLPITVYSGFLIRFREYTPNLVLLFKRYCFTTSPFRKELLSYATTSANTNINQESLSVVKVHFPSLPEQQKIASFLSAVDQKIQQLTRKKELLEQYKKGVMQKLFSQEIRFRDENGKDYPDWEEKRLGGLATINPKSNALPDTFIYIDLESVEKGRLLKEEIIEFEYAPSRAQRLLKKSDILFQTVRPYQKNNYFFDKGGDYVASTGYAQMRAKGDALFLYQLLHYQPLVNLIIRWSTGSNYPAINPSDLRKIPGYVPSAPEQEKIGSFLQEIDLKIDSINTQITQTQKFKKGLLQQMFVYH